MISVIIPARNEKHLNRTIQGLIDTAETELEFIVLLDGYNYDVGNFPNTTIIPFDKALGQRKIINQGAAVARGKYLLHIDAHCTMTHGWDVKMMESCKDDTLVVSPLTSLIDMGMTAKVLDYKRRGFTDEEIINKKEHKTKSTLNIKGVEKADIERILNGENVDWTNRKKWYSFAYIDKSMKTDWWLSYKKKSECEIEEETMAFTGCGWMVQKDTYFELGGHDERMNTYGFRGAEWSLKMWIDLQGKLILRTDVLCGHLFKKKYNYPMSYRKYKATHRLLQELYAHRITPLVERFAPVPGWHKKSCSCCKPSRCSLSGYDLYRSYWNRGDVVSESEWNERMAVCSVCSERQTCLMFNENTITSSVIKANPGMKNCW